MRLDLHTPDRASSCSLAGFLVVATILAMFIECGKRCATAAEPLEILGDWCLLKRYGVETSPASVEPRHYRFLKSGRFFLLQSEKWEVAGTFKYDKLKLVLTDTNGTTEGFAIKTLDAKRMVLINDQNEKCEFERANVPMK